jgi:DNA mismatch repair protein MutS
MMVAYAAARTAAPGHLVLYRVGEFYEVLLDDAVVVSRALGIQLTRRRQKDAADVPMCGVPAATAGSAVNRLLAAGYKVALSEQPAEPSGERPLRLMTPGTSVDPDVLADGRANNLTVALTEGEAVAFAWIDLSTGEAGTCMASLDGCGAALARIAPSEILVARWPDGSDALAVAVRGSGARFSDLSRAELSSIEVDGILAAAYTDGRREALRGFSPPELGALAALSPFVVDWRWYVSSWPIPKSALTAMRASRACQTCCAPAAVYPWARLALAISRRCAAVLTGPRPLRRS